MAYTNPEKATMYRTIHDDLTVAVVKLQDFLENEAPLKDGEQPTDEQNFARQTSNQLSGLIGNLAVHAKRCEDKE